MADLVIQSVPIFKGSYHADYDSGMGFLSMEKENKCNFYHNVALVYLDQRGQTRRITTFFPFTKLGTLLKKN